MNVGDSPEKLRDWVFQQKAAGRKVVFTNGVFDLLHAGHVAYLKKARSLGDVLVVAVNDDASVRRFKGPPRPLVPAMERAETLCALSCVDAVVLFSEDDPLRVIQLLEPDVLVKGGDWPVEKIIGADVVRRRGGEVFSLPYLPGKSTTGMIERILEGGRK